MVNNPSANARDIRDACSIPRLGRSPGGGHGNPLQYSCLEKSMDRGAWWATVLRVGKSGHNRNNLTHMHAEIGCLSWYAGTGLRVSKVKKGTKTKPKQARTKPPQPRIVAFTALHSVNAITTANVSCLDTSLNSEVERCTAAHCYIIFHCTNTRASRSQILIKYNKINRKQCFEYLLPLFLI